MGKAMSEETKQKLANDLGFGDRTADGDWSDVTTGEVGSMVREAIRRGSEAVEKEGAKVNGAVHQNAT
jgi:small acid-soluble spore protein F (minor alpha/beta-type SASP)